MLRIIHTGGDDGWIQISTYRNHADAWASRIIAEDERKVFSECRRNCDIATTGRLPGGAGSMHAIVITLQPRGTNFGMPAGLSHHS